MKTFALMDVQTWEAHKFVTEAQWPAVTRDRNLTGGVYAWFAAVPLEQLEDLAKVRFFSQRACVRHIATIEPDGTLTALTDELPEDAADVAALLHTQVTQSGWAGEERVNRAFEFLNALPERALSDEQLKAGTEAAGVIFRFGDGARAQYLRARAHIRPEYATTVEALDNPDNPELVDTLARMETFWALFILSAVASSAPELPVKVAHRRRLLKSETVPV